MTRIKLCGMTRMEDIQAVNAVKPDFVGFVFAEKSKRYLEPARAEGLRKQLSPGIRAVGVFVDAPVEMVAALLNQGVLDAAQLHGQEDAAYLAALKARTDKPLIQAFRVRSGADIARAEASAADLVLLDAGAGDGKTFDWELLGEVRRDFLLAGGLNPENVEEVVARYRPWGVDVSSGIETEGKKDETKIRAFVRAVRKGEKS